MIKFMQRKTSWGLGRGHCPLPENFSILSLKMATFSAFWVLAHAAREGGGMASTGPLGSANDSIFSAVSIELDPTFDRRTVGQTGP